MNVVRPSVRRPSVHVAIISEPNARISFKFWLLPLMGHTLGLILIFFEKKIFRCFTNIFSFR